MEGLNVLLVKPKPKTQNKFEYHTSELKQDDTFVIDKRELLDTKNLNSMIELVNKIKKTKSNFANYEKPLDTKQYSKNIKEELYMPFDNIITNIINTGEKMIISINVKPEQSEKPDKSEKTDKYKPETIKNPAYKDTSKIYTKKEYDFFV